MFPRIRPAPTLAVAAAVVVGAADAIWLGSRHSVAYRCGSVYVHSPWAQGLAIAGGVVAVASLIKVLLDWVAESTGNGPNARPGRRLSIVLSAIVLLGTVVSLGAMYADATIQLCF